MIFYIILVFRYVQLWLTLYADTLKLELITPLFPQYFLPLASLANLVKGIAGLTLGATKASLNKMFALSENMGDVTAKYQSQVFATCHSHYLPVVGASGLSTGHGSWYGAYLCYTFLKCGSIQLYSLSGVGFCSPMGELCVCFAFILFSPLTIISGDSQKFLWIH